MPMEIDKKPILCCRIDSVIDLRAIERENHLVRINSENPRQREKIDLTPIAVQGLMVFHDGKSQPIRDFLAALNKTQLRRLIVLTTREAADVLDIALEFGALVRCFEESFPVFQNIRYNSNPISRYRELVQNLDKVRHLQINEPTLGRHFSMLNQFRVERKLRFKNSLDANFYHANPRAFQEVFKFFEERPGRVILAFDFNSMYPSCMDGEFLDPRSLRTWQPKVPAGNIEGLKPGLYSAILKYPKKGWFRECHPFEVTQMGCFNKFLMDETHQIHCLAFKFELEFYKQFFAEIEVKEGIVSSATTTHPLKRHASRLYSQKLHYRSQGNHIRQKMCQFELQTLHSTTSKRAFKKRSFPTPDHAAEALSKFYGIAFPSDSTPGDILRALCRMKLVRNLRCSDRVTLSMLDVKSKYNVHSLTAQVIAKARIKLLSLIQEMIAWPDLSLCYANTDSVHVSIKADELDSFIDHFRAYLTSGMGQLKLQCTAARGYWFDTGRYWLFDDNNRLVQFGNKLFNVGGNAPFGRHRKVKSIVEAPSFRYTKTLNALLFNFFEYGKRLSSIDDQHLDHLNYERYTFDEVRDLYVAGDIRTQEMLRTKGFKISLFRRIATV